MTIHGKRGKPNRRVRLEEIARNCGVSVSTASRALAGTGGVKDELRAKIVETALALGYVNPTSAAGR
ncbi:MAG: LacI family DNA-binding transcriptional regulator, partial [Martelella sp.]